MIRVWDLVVRLFHRGLAACFALAWLTAEEAQAHTNGWAMAPR